MTQKHPSNTRAVPVICALLIAVIFAAPVSGQVTGTTFVPGLGENGAIWDRNGSIDYINGRVQLGTIQRAWLPTSESLDYQRWVLQTYYVNSGSQLLVGHSMGGLVSRYAAVYGNAPVGGIITVSTPHGGAPVANSFVSLKAYIVSTANAVADAISGALGIVAGGVVDLIARHVLHNAVESNINRVFYPETQSIRDVKVGSPVISLLSVGDGFPHGNVYGQLDARYAWMRVSASAINSDGSVNTWIGYYQKATTLLKACEYIGYATIVNWGRAKRCSKGYKALTSIDGQWQSITTAYGSSSTSDGFIPTSRLIYPGTSSGDFTNNTRVLGVNHNDIIYRISGMDAIASQMFRVGMTGR